MSTEKGGLKPIKRGGGKQTRTLRVEDPQGRQYSLRSIQKFITSKTLPADLQSEAAEDLVADGVSASYPYAALSVPILAEAAGVPYLKVKVVYIPDDPKLDSFRKDFANLLAYFEERVPEGVEKGYDTDEVADKLKEDNDNSVDQKALLRARILDMFVMDLDRHEDQWTWAAVEKEKGKQRKEGKTTAKKQIAEAYQSALNRRPTSQEMKKLVSCAQKHGMTSLCRVILNTSEFMFAD